MPVTRRCILCTKTPNQILDPSAFLRPQGSPSPGLELAKELVAR